MSLVQAIFALYVVLTTIAFLVVIAAAINSSRISQGEEIAESGTVYSARPESARSEELPEESRRRLPAHPA